MLTLEEFNKFVDSFHKNPGEYTNEEIMDIGVKFKSLPKNMKSWEQLRKKLGVSQAAETLRGKVFKYCVSHPELFTNEEQQENYAENFIEEQKARDWYNAYKRELRDTHRIDNLIHEIQLAADKFKDFPSLPNIELKNKENIKEAVLIFSDLHIGVECDNYYNKYNLDIAKARVSLLAEKVIDYCNKNNVQQLDFLNGGDLIDGIIHTNARIENQMDVAEQIMNAAEIVANFLYRLAGSIPVITYRSVTDNHSRAIADKKEAIEKEQFSRIITWFVKERLKNTSIEFKDDNIDPSIGKFKLINGKTIMFAHGHMDSRERTFQNWVGLTREWIDYILLCHYHNTMVKESQGTKMFVNGSIMGDNSYAFNCRLFAKAQQKLLIFDTNKNKDDVMDIDIYLQDNN